MKKAKLLLLLSLLSISSYAQIGIGTATPRGALDINKPTTNDAGLVLPTNGNIANIKNPLNAGNPVPGTIIYDSSLDCVRLYKGSGAWSGCIGGNNVSKTGKSLHFATTSNAADGDAQAYLFKLADRTLFGPTGTYTGSGGITWITINSNTYNYQVGGNYLDAFVSGDEIYNHYDIIHLGRYTPFLSSSGTNTDVQILFQKLKRYVDLGGVLFIQLNSSNNRYLNQLLFQQYVGVPLSYAYTHTVNNIKVTNHSANSGPFGDRRNQLYTTNFATTYNYPIAYAPINPASLPTDSEVFVTAQSGEPLIFAAGPGQRVFFFFSEYVTQGIGSTAQGDVEKSIFLYNLTAYMSKKAGY